ncbi:MAG: 4'-phosphopantetheinyl transferase superfamily protein [Muribaculaceae bacterium]|nr:4'-phosphopantetheinyl transferase superfamily protein [Muribaculaceae bacterium]
MDFIYWRHPTPPGIKVEEITGGDYYKGDTWRQMAVQLYGENGKEAYREIGHYNSGAPFLINESSRISITHCPGLWAVATLPSTPEVNLNEFSSRACLGIDAERADRSQVLRLRERFLNSVELNMIDADDLTSNIMAWTMKEAAYKAALTPGLDFREQIVIKRMPKLGPPTPVFDAGEFGLPKGTKNIPEDFFGDTELFIQERVIKLRVYSYISDDFIVTLCYSPNCAKFGSAVS